MNYYEATGNDPLEVVNQILKTLACKDEGEIDFYNEETGKHIDINMKAEYTTPMSFQVLLYMADKTYKTLAGTLVNRGMNDLLKPVWDAGAELELLEIP